MIDPSSGLTEAGKKLYNVFEVIKLSNQYSITIVSLRTEIEKVIHNLRNVSKKLGNQAKRNTIINKKI